MYGDKLKNDKTETYELASIGSRFAASLIDGFILSIAAGLLLGLIRGNGSFAISSLIYFLYDWYFWTQRDGQTPGKAVMNIKIIRVNGAPMSAGDSVLRYVGYWISSIILGLGYLWALFDSQSQAWHDKIAGTYVIKVAPDARKRKYVSI
jgi:uncharacterized RDD family membrane protein YckC